jgi:hypothetical protein
VGLDGCNGITIYHMFYIALRKINGLVLEAPNGDAITTILIDYYYLANVLYLGHKVIEGFSINAKKTNKKPKQQKTYAMFNKKF